MTAAVYDAPRTITVRPLDDFDRDVLATVPRSSNGGWGMTARDIVWDPNNTAGRPVSTHREIASQWTGALLDSPSAVIVYESAHDGSVQFGVARVCREAGVAGYTENTYEVSPFPGGWELVRESQVLAVRHTHAI